MAQPVPTAYLMPLSGASRAVHLFFLLEQIPVQFQFLRVDEPLPAHLNPVSNPNLALPVLEFPASNLGSSTSTATARQTAALADLRVDGVETVLRVASQLPRQSSGVDRGLSPMYAALPSSPDSPDLGPSPWSSWQLCEWQAVIDSLCDWHARVLRPTLSSVVLTRVWPALFSGAVGLRQTSMSTLKTASFATGSDPLASSSSASAVEVVDRAVVEQQTRGRNELDACIDFLEATLVRANSGGCVEAHAPEFLCGAAPSIADLVIATSLVVWDALPVRERPALDESHHRPRLHRWLRWWAARPEWHAAHAEHDAFSAKRRAELE